MTASSLHSVARRLLANVDKESGDSVDSMYHVPVRSFRDTERYRRELDAIFHKCPLLVALSVDVSSPGDFTALTLAQRPLLVVRGDDGVARTFLNICRHRGAQVTPQDPHRGDQADAVCFGSARRFTCPYHFWVYDTNGTLVGNTAREAFAGIDVEGLVELPTAERSGAIFAVLTPGAPMDIDDWLGDMASALEYIQLDKLHRHRDGIVTDSGNWKTTADGYVDGYHLGYLHRSTIGAKSITNRNTYDCFGPHLRLGFSNKPILSMRDLPDDEWNLREAMSLVHYIFPNVSISGLPGSGLMMSRLMPGDTPDRCRVEQFQYFREPMVTDEQIAEADAKRALYFAVTKDEDFHTVRQITDALSAMEDDVMRYGRNEVGSQNLYKWIDAIVDGRRP